MSLNPYPDYKETKKGYYIPSQWEEVTVNIKSIKPFFGDMSIDFSEGFDTQYIGKITEILAPNLENDLKKGPVTMAIPMPRGVDLKRASTLLESLEKKEESILEDHRKVKERLTGFPSLVENSETKMFNRLDNISCVKLDLITGQFDLDKKFEVTKGLLQDPDLFQDQIEMGPVF